MAKRETLRALTAAVAHAEVIPADRPLTREEINLLDHLAARLRKQFFGDRSEEIQDLLRRVSAVRTGKRDTTTTTKVTPAAKAPAAKKRQPPSQKTKNKKSANKLNAELHRISGAGRPISKADAVALDGIVEQLCVLAEADRRVRLLWLRALDVREYLTGKSSVPDRDRSGVPSAGRVGRPRGLDLARREVLGGLPSSRRGH
ncbi:hypothetical protein [Mycobacteroides abscessus]|uniref:hypothetical protein n=1 Tax=Mycobacteroides abscessus TaxID=36809 RepID=UPI00092C6F10|nr:hypothetical protein [Mycobacteroides abscessus]SIG32279.1 Uncharacterised protein [Mycobacteroides abscessus subsp. abscessus]SIG44160.1 Uncharacterised protein [Mycobacteroides abscessus subsp. abscessus]SIM97695.1 Uncharacterised protein [Mycobacteroides abscessus subsp. abscessus]SIN10669.1 Uncharacterised protein [Mycobacteroides abscessus subsp. abscessus]SIN15094.1 Uncharacterised protein [Mycobacteroides abscessus subsp. abscessus]